MKHFSTTEDTVDTEDQNLYEKVCSEGLFLLSSVGGEFEVDRYASRSIADVSTPLRLSAARKAGRSGAWRYASRASTLPF